MNKNSLIKNRLIKSSLLNENQFSFSEEKFEKKISDWFENALEVKFQKKGTNLFFEIAFYEIANKKEINLFSFQLKNNTYSGTGYNVLSIDDFCTKNNLENKWNSVNNFNGNSFEEKLNNLIIDFEQFIRSTDLIKVFRGEVWYDQYWINYRD